MKFINIFIGVVFQLFAAGLTSSSPAAARGGMENGPIKIALAKRAGAGSSPLDINNEIGGSLNTLSALVGTLGHSSSGLVMGLAGVSITDCAGQIKDKNLDKLPCDEFLDALSECDSLTNVKPLLQQAKKNYNKKPNKKAPCFKNKSKSRKH